MLSWSCRSNPLCLCLGMFPLHFCHKFSVSNLKVRHFIHLELIFHIVWNMYLIKFSFGNPIFWKKKGRGNFSFNEFIILKKRSLFVGRFLYELKFHRTGLSILKGTWWCLCVLGFTRACHLQTSAFDPPLWCTFFLSPTLIVLAETSSTLLNTKSEYAYLHPAPDLMRKILSFFHSVWHWLYVGCVWCIVSFILRNVTSMPKLSSVFVMKQCWIISNALSSSIEINI